jgi:DNA primase
MKKTDLSDLYQHYRGKLDVRQILDHYGAQNVTEVVSADGSTELVHSCLLDRVEPHHAHGDAHPSACANVDKGLYVCYSYWGGDIFHLIQKLEGRDDFASIVPVLSDFFCGATHDSVRVRKDLDTIFAEPMYAVDLPSYSEKVLPPVGAHPYMLGRGITMEAHKLLRIGYDAKDNRIVFPHFFDGKLVGWQKRAIPPDNVYRWLATCPQWPKYKSSSGMPKSETLYGWDQLWCGNPACDHVVVVESPMSVARAYSEVIHNVVATFGAYVAKAQIDLLKQFRSVTVWMDDDPAGQRGCHKLVKALYRHTEVLVVTPDKGRDLGDCTYEQAIDKLNAARPAALWLAEYDGFYDIGAMDSKGLK